MRTGGEFEAPAQKQVEGSRQTCDKTYCNFRRRVSSTIGIAEEYDDDILVIPFGCIEAELLSVYPNLHQRAVVIVERTRYPRQSLDNDVESLRRQPRFLDASKCLSRYRDEVWSSVPNNQG